MLLTLVAGFILVGTQDPHEGEIAALIHALKTSESPMERKEAAKGLQLWIWPAGKGINGFSDSTVDRPPKPQKLANDLYDRVVTALAVALNDPKPAVRKTAAEALGGVTGARPAVHAAVLTMLKTNDSDQLWYGMQALGRVAPPAEQAVPLLIALLAHNSETVRDEAYRALGDYGPKARGVVPQLLKLLPKEARPWAVLYALGKIGLTEDEAKELAAAKLHKAEDCDDARFTILMVYPDVAIPFLNARPKLFEKTITPERLFDLITSVDPKTQVLRNALLDRTDLPVVVMGWSQDPRFLPAIQERIKKASKHEATLLTACARACGSPADRVVKPDGFKPKSAIPGMDPSRQGEGGGHGDGWTEILVTGRLLMADGSPAVDPVFINENDRMLMGTREESRGPLRYDPKTGRFAFYSTVFAAYSMDGKQTEPGPYQTGSAQVRIEAQGTKPLVLHFWDEMPDLAIALTPGK